MDEEEHAFPGSPHDEDAILKSPSVSETSKSPDESTAADDIPTKKVVLKRKHSHSPPILADTPTTEKVSKLEIVTSDASENGKNDSGNENDKKAVKISELTGKERLDLRAKKFGTPIVGDALKIARAERFGIAAKATPDKSTPDKLTPDKPTPDKASSGKIVNDTTTNVEVLRKRAERFGGSVSTVMNTIENKEKLAKRQERFGANGAPIADSPLPEATKTNTDTNNVVSAKNDYAEKAKLRLERFKAAVK